MNSRVVLELLEGLERLETRVLVVEPGDVADVHAVAVEVIDEAAGVGARGDGPAHRVLDEAGLGTAGRELPQLLDAKAVGLRLAPVGEAEARHDLLGHAAAAALGEHRRASAYVGAWRVVGTRLAVPVEAHVADADARDAAVLDERLRRGEPGKDVDAERFGARGEDRGELAERDDPVAAVVHLRRRRHAHGARPGEVPELVARRGHADVGRRVAPARQQRVERFRLERAAGDQMRADRGSLLQHADAGIGLQLLEPYGGGEAGGTAAHDHDVVFHDVALGHGIRIPANCGRARTLSPTFARSPATTTVMRSGRMKVRAISVTCTGVTAWTLATQCVRKSSGRP